MMAVVLAGEKGTRLASFAFYSKRRILDQSMESSRFTVLNMISRKLKNISLFRISISDEE